jgi:preprotein translocase subunit SecE
MSLVKSEDNKKWINTFSAICSIIVGYVLIQFLQQMGEWFDLEARVPHFLMISQGLGIVSGLITFIIITRNRNSSTHLNEVFAELVKVIWPKSDDVIKSTVVIIIGLSLMSGLFVGVDFTFQKLLELLY